MAGSAIRGSRVGAGPMGEVERGEPAARVVVMYYCCNGHETGQSFAADASFPGEWDCPRCGKPAGTNAANPPQPVKIEPYKTHLAYVRERRSDDEAEKILSEALSELRGD